MKLLKEDISTKHSKIINYITKNFQLSGTVQTLCLRYQSSGRLEQ